MPAPEPTQYDSFAAEYEAHAETAPYNALYDRPATLELLGDVRGLRVLDVACGPGLYATELIERGAHVVGCDASPAMVELAGRRTAGAVDLRVHAMEQPFDWVDDDSFDVVLNALAYHYVNDRLAFLCEARRMLRPGGAMVISTHHPTSDWARLGGSYFDVSPVTEVWSKGWEITAWRAPLTVLCQEFADAGFLVERLVEPLPTPEMATTHPAVYERLTVAPGFVLFRLRPG